MKSLVNTAIVSTMWVVATTAVADDISPAELVKLQESGRVKPYETLDALALGLHAGATPSGSELELEGGRYVYQVELRDSQGIEHDIKLDATTGEVLENHRDN